MARYEAGETLASIARTYDCSPPAISYVVSRSRARAPVAEAAARPPSVSEPQLIKTAGEGAVSGPGAPPPSGSSDANGRAANEAGESRRPDAEPYPSRSDAGVSNPAPIAGERRGPNPPREANGFARDGAADRGGQPLGAAPSQPPRFAAPAPPPLLATAPPHTNGSDQRRTLHLSLGNGGSGNGAAEPQPSARVDLAGRGQPPQSHPDAPHRGRDGAGPTSFSEIRPAFDEPARRGADAAPRKEGGGSFIDKELRARVDTDIAAFLAAFDAALVQDTQESRTALREATDRLLRAGARTRIELERLEARMPLPARGNGGSGEPAWRYR